MPPTRRSLLAALGAGASGLAGCLSGGTDTPADRDTPSATDTQSPTDTASPTETATESPTPGPGIGLSIVADLSSIDAPILVFPSTLRGWLERAARSGETLRTHVDVGQYDPEPVLPRFERVRLQTDVDALAGTYELNAEGGTRYQLLVGTERVSDVPANASVTPVADLPEARRTFASEAITDSARVYPETKLGSWVRHEFFGGYFRYDGATYRGTELQQTDAEFFAQEVWYVLALEPADVTPEVTLVLRDLPFEVRSTVSSLLEGETTPRYEPTATDVPDVVGAFAAETDYLLTHTGVYEVSAI